MPMATVPRSARRNILSQVSATNEPSPWPARSKRKLRRSCRRLCLLLSRDYWKAALVNGGDHVRPDAAFDRSLAKSTLEGFGCRFRGRFQARSITGLDFAPQRSALTVGNRRIARRRRPALAIDGLDGNLFKSRRHELRADFFHIVIAMGDAGHEARRVGNSVASACVTTSANSFSEIRSHTL